MGMMGVGGVGEGGLVGEGVSEGVEGLGVGLGGEGVMVGGGRFGRFLCGWVGSTAFGVIKVSMVANCLLFYSRDTLSYYSLG